MAGNRNDREWRGPIVFQPFGSGHRLWILTVFFGLPGLGDELSGRGDDDYSPENN